jgi:hypothetical protein
VTIFARRHARLRSEEVILTSRLSCPPRKLDGYLGEASEGPPLFGAALSFAFQAWVLAITVLAFHRQPNARQAAPAGFMNQARRLSHAGPAGRCRRAPADAERDRLGRALPGHCVCPERAPLPLVDAKLDKAASPLGVHFRPRWRGAAPPPPFPYARVDGLEPVSAMPPPAARGQAIFLGTTEPRATRPEGFPPRGGSRIVA